MKIGIDLGTTNSALAYIDEREAEDRDFPPLHIFETPQLVAAGRVEPRRTLPSFLYLEDGPAGRRLRARTGRAGAHPAGALARNRGSPIPMSIAPRRFCRGIRRRPAACSRRWKFRRASSRNSARSGTRRRVSPLAEQEIVLTVPASFDEEARELTVMAATRCRPRKTHAAGRAGGGLLFLDREQPRARRARSCSMGRSCWFATWAAAPAISA